MYSTSPAFNLKAVLKQTGIAADTLRAWERRYGLPMPQRSPGGHRLYSQRDVETVKWLIKRQEAGLSISRAVDLWNEQIASGADPLAGSSPAAFSPAPSMSLENLRRDWLAACFKYDTVEAEQILNEAFAIHSVELICTEVIMRGLYEIGELWHKGVASVQQEHFASGLAMRRLEALISASPPPTRPETIITACPPDEWHVFPLLLVSLFLRRRGWNVVHLGAVVPIDRMEETVSQVQPNLIVLSSQTLITALSLRDMARALRERGFHSAFGGRVFNHLSMLAARIPGHFLGNSIESAIPTVESLITNPTALPDEAPVDAESVEVAGAFREHRSMIEKSLMDGLRSSGQAVDYLDTANRFLGNTLIASLELGDISYTSTEISWLTNLLIERNVSLSMLPLFLDAYAKSTRDVMGKDGQRIYDWLSTEAQKLNG